ncbi:MAG: hypothetical protein II453_18200 [Alphaproteobacteria bacterium]|nr:hypothetical protein [Alphaproteobacteria bacterium]
MKLKAELPEKYYDQILSFPSCQSVQGLVEKKNNDKLILTQDWEEKVINELPKNYALDVITYDPKIAQKNTLKWIENMYKTYGIVSQQEQSKKIKNKANPKPLSKNEINKQDSKKSDLRNEFVVLQNFIAGNKQLKEVIDYIYGSGSDVLEHKKVQIFSDNLEKWKNACQDVYEVAIKMFKEPSQSQRNMIQQVVESTMSNDFSKRDIKLYLTQFNLIRQISDYDIFQNDNDILKHLMMISADQELINRWREACATCRRLCNSNNVTNKEIMENIVYYIFKEILSEKQAELYVKNYNLVQKIFDYRVYKCISDILSQLANFGNNDQKMALWLYVCQNAKQNYRELCAAQTLMSLSSFVNKIMEFNGDMTKMKQYITKQSKGIKPNNHTHEQIDRFRKEYSLSEDMCPDDKIQEALMWYDEDYDVAFHNLIDELGCEEL